MSINLSAGGVSKAVALTALGEVADRWGVAKTKRYLLLGEPESTVNHWYGALRKDAMDQNEQLGGSMLERISHLVSIYDALHRFLVGAEADEWMKRPNAAFGGRSPVDLLLAGSFENIVKVRHYVDRVVHQ